MSQKVDLRVRRTHVLLRQAFIELLLAEGFEAITVQMLANRAMINRATFYRHYVDKFDLANRVYEEITHEYVTSTQQAEANDSISAWRLLFEHVGTYADFYLAMMSGMPSFRARMQSRIEQQMHADLLRWGLDETKVTMPLPLILRYLATAQMGVVQWWLEEEQPLPATEMAQYLFQLGLQGGVQPLQLPIDFLQNFEENK